MFSTSKIFGRESWPFSSISFYRLLPRRYVHQKPGFETMRVYPIVTVHFHSDVQLCTCPISVLFLSLLLLSYICNYRCALHNYCADGKTRWVALSEAGRLSLVRVGEERLQVWIFQVNLDGDRVDDDLTISMMSWAHGT